MQATQGKNKARRRAVRTIAICVLGLRLGIPGAAAQDQTAPQAVSAPQADNAPATMPGTLTIDQAAAYASWHNSVLESAQIEILRQTGVVNQAKTGLHPTVSATSDASHSDSQRFQYFGDQPFGRSERDSLFLGVNGTIPLDISGEIRTAVSQAEYQALAARCSLAATRNDVLAAARDSYYAALRAHSLVDAAKNDLLKAEDRLRETQIQIEAGTMAHFEVQRAKTAVAAAQNVVFAAEQNADLAISQLRQAIGMEQNTPLAITEAGADIDDVDVTRAGAEPVVRPEIFQSAAEVAAADKGFKLAKQSMRPSLFLSGNVGHTPIGGRIGEGIATAQVSATFVLPIYDAGVSHAQMQQAIASQASARAQQTLIRQQVDLEVRQAVIMLQNAASRVPISDAALDAAKESYELAKMRFTEGEAPQIEVTDAQGALTQAQRDIINARWDLLAAKNAYKRAIGRYAFISPTEAASFQFVK